MSIGEIAKNRDALESTAKKATPIGRPAPATRDGRTRATRDDTIAGMAVALGLDDDDDMETDLPEIIGNETRSFVEDNDGRFAKSVQRVRERLHFVRMERQD